jgi:putative transposase
VGESELNLTLMELIDKLFLDDPTLGVKGMRDELRDLGSADISGERRV